MRQFDVAAVRDRGRQSERGWRREGIQYRSTQRLYYRVGMTTVVIGSESGRDAGTFSHASAAGGRGDVGIAVLVGVGWGGLVSGAEVGVYGVSFWFKSGVGAVLCDR